MSGQVSDDERGPGRTGPVPLGEALRTARTEQGRSLAEVSHAINLRETVVQAIEHDDFALCGGDVYARGHIRAYARLLGLDPAPLVRSYDERTGAPPEGARVALLADDDVPLERSGPNWPVLVGAALVVVLALLGWQLVSELRGPARPVEQVVGTTPSGTRTTPPAAPTSAGPTNAGTTPPPATSTGPAGGPTSGTGTAGAHQVAVALKITGASWVEVRDAKGRTVYSGLLSKGDVKRFSDTAPLRLTLGNAGGVELTVNGTSLGTAGKAGEVKRLTFRPGEEAQLS